MGLNGGRCCLVFLWEWAGWWVYSLFTDRKCWRSMPLRKTLGPVYSSLELHATTGEFFLPKADTLGVVTQKIPDLVFLKDGFFVLQAAHC